MSSPVAGFAPPARAAAEPAIARARRHLAALGRRPSSARCLSRLALVLLLTTRNATASEPPRPTPSMPSLVVLRGELSGRRTAKSRRGRPTTADNECAVASRAGAKCAALIASAKHASHAGDVADRAVGARSRTSISAASDRPRRSRASVRQHAAHAGRESRRRCAAPRPPGDRAAAARRARAAAYERECARRRATSPASASPSGNSIVALCAQPSSTCGAPPVVDLDAREPCRRPARARAHGPSGELERDLDRHRLRLREREHAQPQRVLLACRRRCVLEQHRIDRRCATVAS